VVHHPRLAVLFLQTLVMLLYAFLPEILPLVGVVALVLSHRVMEAGEEEHHERVSLRAHMAKGETGCGHAGPMPRSVDTRVGPSRVAEDRGDEVGSAHLIPAPALVGANDTSSPCLSIPTVFLGKHGVSLAPPERITPAERMVENDSVRWSAIDHEANKPVEHLPEAARYLRPEDLCEVITYLMDHGESEFSYDGEMDVFRFSEDGRFAFCEEFADWHLLEKRGWLDF
jgi:hypothetical protein